MANVRYPISVKTCHTHWHALWLISGEDGFLMQDAIETLQEVARQKSYTIQRLNIQKKEQWTELLDISQQRSLLSNQTFHLIQVKNWTLSADDIQIIQNLSKIPDKVWAIYGPKLSKATLNKKTFKPLVEKANHLPIWPLDPKQIVSWTQQKSSDLSLKMSQEAIHLCIDQAGHDEARIHQTLRHLSLLNRTHIDRSHIEALTQKHHNISLFTWHELILKGDLNHALSTLPCLQKDRVEPVALLGLLQKSFEQITELLWAKTQNQYPEALKKLYPWPKQRQMVNQGLMSLPPKTLTQIRQDLFEIERTFKTTYPFDVFQALSQLLLKHIH